MNNMEIVHVQETKLLGVTLDCKLSWTKHIDAIVAKMERSVHNKAMLCFLDMTMNKASPTGSSLSHLDYCPVTWSSATNKDIGKLQLAQSSTAGPKCTLRANINDINPQSRGEIDFITACI